MTTAGKRRLGRRLAAILLARSSVSVTKSAKRYAAFALAAGAMAVATVPALAQGWWPWSGGQQQDRGAPVPREPVYRDPPAAAPPPIQGQNPGQSPNQSAGQAPGQAGWASGTKNPICLQLEQRLVQEGQRGNESRNLVPTVENELRQVDQDLRNAEQQLDKSDCYEYFLFSKTLRRTRRCVDLANQADASRRRSADLDTQLQQLNSSAGRSYQDDIVRELARNNCGASYQQQARRQPDSDSSTWSDEESSGGGNVGSFGNLPYATYRTICVRLCDGYYFPISFSTLPNHFERDAEACQSKCAAPAELYYHQNPGAGVDQAVAARTNEPYTQLKSAFRYRKEYVSGCSCNMAEYVPEAGAPQRQGGALPGQTGAVQPGQTGAVQPGQTGAVLPGQTGLAQPGQQSATTPTAPAESTYPQQQPATSAPAKSNAPAQRAEAPPLPWQLPR